MFAETEVGKSVGVCETIIIRFRSVGVSQNVQAAVFGSKKHALPPGVEPKPTKKNSKNLAASTSRIVGTIYIPKL